MFQLKLKSAAIAAAFVLGVATVGAQAQPVPAGSPFGLQTVNTGATGMPNNPAGLPGLEQFIPKPPARCSPADQPAEQAKCEKAEKCRVLRAELAELQKNAAILQSLSGHLASQSAAITTQINALLHSSDNFLFRTFGLCVKNALEARTLALGASSMRAACAQGNFGWQCIAQGAATPKEVMTYLAQNKDVQNAVMAITTQTATFVVKSSQPGKQPATYSLPVIGNTCAAYNWSDQIFSAPQLIENLGVSQRNLQKASYKIKKLMDENNKKIQAVQAELRKLGC